MIKLFDALFIPGNDGDDAELLHRNHDDDDDDENGGSSPSGLDP